jgi:hypothetical protein
MNASILAITVAFSVSAIAQQNLESNCSSLGPPGVSVASEGGNIFFVSGGTRRKLTDTGKDSEPHLSGDGRLVVFLRTVSPKTQFDLPTEVHVVATDGSGRDAIVFDNPVPFGQVKLDGKLNPQFAPDNASVYFMVGTADTSWGLVRLELATRKTQLLVEKVLDYCVVQAGRYRGMIVAGLRKTLVLQPWADWFWLLGSDGREIEAIGNSGNLDEFWDVSRSTASRKERVR